MTTRSAVTPPEAAAWVVTRHPEFVEVLEREARGMLAEGKNARLANALIFTATELRAAGRDMLASLEGAAVAQLAGVEQVGQPVSASVSSEEAAERLGVGVRQVRKLIASGPLVRAGRGRVDAVSLALEVARRATAADGRSSEAS